MKAELTLSLVKSLEPAPTKQIVWDAKIDGFGLKIEPSGTKSFVYVYRFPRGRAGKVRWFTIGKLGTQWTVAQAREEAEGLQAECNRGGDPMARVQAERQAAEAARLAPKRSVEAIAKEFVERYAKKRNRSWEETQRILNRDVVPAWGRKQIGDVTRADVNDLLDKIEDESGAPMASAVLAQVRKMFNWHATRDGSFNSPIVRGMGRTDPNKRKRQRTLSDDEIKVLWEALDKVSPPFRQLVRFLLLTAQRRSEPSKAHRMELGSEGVGANAIDLWSIPAERYKTNKPNLVPLTPQALAQLDDLPKVPRVVRRGKAKGSAADYVFTTTGDKPFSGFSKAKAALDAEMEAILRKRAKAAGLKVKGNLLVPWVLHDLRRTAKTLMQRGGVRPDISERVLGHTIKGVEGVYDKWAYLPEKRHALTVLAAEVEAIVKGRQSNVVPLRSAVTP